MAEVAAMLQPLRKQLKKHSSRLEKVETNLKDTEKKRQADSEQLQTLQQTVLETNALLTTLRDSLNARPWQFDIEKMQAEMRTVDQRSTSAVDELRVQLTAHAQVFQGSQTSVASQAEQLNGVQADAAEHRRKTGEELRSITTRLDHMRGEFSERVTHTFGEATTHADRLMTRLQQDLLRLEQDVGQRAISTNVAESSAALQRELHKLSGSHEELQRQVCIPRFASQLPGCWPPALIVLGLVVLGVGNASWMLACSAGQRRDGDACGRNRAATALCSEECSQQHANQHGAAAGESGGDDRASREADGGRGGRDEQGARAAPGADRKPAGLQSPRELTSLHRACDACTLTSLTRLTPHPSSDPLSHCLTPHPSSDPLSHGRTFIPILPLHPLQTAPAPTPT